MVDLSAEAARIPAGATAEERMRALIDTISSYIEYYHGGSVKLINFDGEVARLELGGACLGCPLSPATLQGWVAGTIRQFFPNVRVVAEMPEAASPPPKKD